MGRNDSLRTVIENARKLRKVRARSKLMVSNGQRLEERSTGDTIIRCAKCGAAVVDSRHGREGHAQRMPECREAMETNPGR